MNRFEEYINLLSREEELYKLSESNQINYTLEFGHEILSNLELKIESIILKKKISLIQASINKGEVINQDEIDRLANKDTEAYRLELEDLKNQMKQAGSSKRVNPSKREEAKKLFRDIAKYFHPDINPSIKFDEKLMELWNKCLEAYRLNDFKALVELDLKCRLALKERGIDIEIAIPLDLEDKITEVENRISYIVNNEPYTYSLILSNKNLRDNKHSELEKEKNDYLKYKEELEKIYYSLTGGLAS